MKHIFSFCIALCSIVLTAGFFTADFPQGKSPQSYFKDQKSIVDAFHSEASPRITIAPVSFSPGALPERISVPEPEIRSLHAVNDQKDMTDENRDLNGLLYKDLEPNSEI